MLDHPSKEKELKKYIDELNKKSKNPFIKSIILDVTDIKAVESVVDNFGIGELSYFLYCVGVNKLQLSFEVNETDWDKMMDINVKGFFFLAREVAGVMLKNNGGSIVSIASAHGHSPNYERATYCASKSALLMTCKVLALEWAPYNIRVNSVSPSIVACVGSEKVTGHQGYSKKWLNSIPMHRFVSPSEVADAAAFLLFGNTKLITGTDILVDGGWLIKH